MPLHSQKLLLVLRVVHYKIVRGQKDIDPHVGVIEVFRIKEFPQLFAFFCCAKEGKHFQ